MKQCAIKTRYKATMLAHQFKAPCNTEELLSIAVHSKTV